MIWSGRDLKETTVVNEHKNRLGIFVSVAIPQIFSGSGCFEVKLIWSPGQLQAERGTK
jgi:hypothetical protein